MALHTAVGHSCSARLQPRCTMRALACGTRARPWGTSVWPRAAPECQLLTSRASVIAQAQPQAQSSKESSAKQGSTFTLLQPLLPFSGLCFTGMGMHFLGLLALLALLALWMGVCGLVFQGPSRQNSLSSQPSGEGFFQQ